MPLSDQQICTFPTCRCIFLRCNCGVLMARHPIQKPKTSSPILFEIGLGDKENIVDLDSNFPYGIEVFLEEYIHRYCQDRTLLRNGSGSSNLCFGFPLRPGHLAFVQVNHGQEVAPKDRALAWGRTVMQHPKANEVYLNLGAGNNMIFWSLSFKWLHIWSNWSN